MKTKLSFICILLFYLYSCKDSSPINPVNQPEDGSLDRIEIHPNGELILDPWWDEDVLSIQGFDSDDNIVSDLDIQWSSSADSVVEVNENGELITHYFGDAWIKAASNEIVDSIKIIVQQQGNALFTPPADFPSLGPVNPPATWVVQRDVNTGFLSANPDAEMTVPGGNTALDFDLDGDIDLFASHQDNFTTNSTAVKVWLNEGSGNFTDGTDKIFSESIPPIDKPRNKAIFDANGDDLLDIYFFQHGFDPGGANGLDCSNIECPGAPNVLLIQQAGGGLIDTGPTAIQPYHQHGFTHAGAVADIDGDGDIDVFEGQWRSEVAPDPTRILLNDGSGNFTEVKDLLPQEVLNGGMVGTAFGDLDRDGDPDLVVSIDGGPGLILSVNNGFGEFRRVPGDLRPTNPQIEGFTNGYSDIQIGDVDLDGWPDILLPSHGENAIVALLLNNGDMTFRDVTGTNIPIEDIGTQSAIESLIDLNGDGWLDYIPNTSVLSNSIYWNTGNGIFKKTTFEENLIGSVLTVGDFNGDGKPDLHVDWFWNWVTEEAPKSLILWNE